MWPLIESKPRSWHTVQPQITSHLSVKPSERHFRGEDSWFLSVHSFSVRGQLALLGPSLSQWCCGRCVCVSALSRVIAMCQRAWPSLTQGICRLVCVAWVTVFFGCPVFSFPFSWLLRCWLVFWTHSNCETVHYIKVALFGACMVIIRVLAFDVLLYPWL